MKLLISQSQLKRAQELYEFNNLRNSISEGKSQLYGAMVRLSSGTGSVMLVLKLNIMALRTTI